jgi:predicted nucleic acid-binding protein
LPKWRICRPYCLACRDRSDAVFLQLMIASRADLLVSGDDDLVALAADYPVVSPATLHQRLAPPR